MLGGMELRLARATDAPGIHEIYGPIVTGTAISFELTVPSVDAMAERVTALQERYPWLVVDDAGQIAGYAYGSAHRSRAAYGWSTDVSVYVHPAAHRRGVGRALYAALLELLRHQRFEQAFAGIALPNPASVGLHEAMGFSPVGVYRDVGWKLGRWHDVGWWQRRLGPHDARPDAASPAGTRPEPRPPHALPELDPDEIDRALDLGTSRLGPQPAR
jgi:phosphinothricin acetyltransferase